MKGQSVRRVLQIKNQLRFADIGAVIKQVDLSRSRSNTKPILTRNRSNRKRLMEFQFWKRILGRESIRWFRTAVNVSGYPEFTFLNPCLLPDRFLAQFRSVHVRSKNRNRHRDHQPSLPAQHATPRNIGEESKVCSPTRYCQPSRSSQ